MIMSFYGYIPKKDFVSLPGNFLETVYYVVSLSCWPRCKVHLNSFKSQ